MITLQPREQQAHEFPEPGKSLVLVNETLARMDIEAVFEDGVITVKVVGLYLGKSAEAPQDQAKKVFRLG